MREIKFRAWDKECYQKELCMYSWKEMNEVQFDTMFENPRYVLMQYTGLKDINGRDIYEGDIVQMSTSWNSSEQYTKKYGYIRVVEWDNKSAKFTNVIAEKVDPYYDLIEVIGNIYENPELLK